MVVTQQSSESLNPRPRLGEIRAPLVAVNSADDLINPPDQGVLKREITHVPHGRAMNLPEGVPIPTATRRRARWTGIDTLAIQFAGQAPEGLAAGAIDLTIQTAGGVRTVAVAATDLVLVRNRVGASLPASLGAGRSPSTFSLTPIDPTSTSNADEEDDSRGSQWRQELLRCSPL